MSVHADGGNLDPNPGEAHCAIAIAGGGLVGATLALALGRAGASVFLLEARAAQAQGNAAFEARPIALSQSSRRILQSLGVWDGLAQAVTPITRIHVSDRGHFGVARLCAEDHGVDALGYVLSAEALARALQAALQSLDAVSVLRPAVVTEAVPAGDLALRLSIEGGAAAQQAGPARVHTKLMVLCDGGRSPLRVELGIPAREQDYGQWAVTARVEARSHHGGVAFERFTNHGPLALLPMHGHHCGLVWSMDAERSERLLALDDGDFLAVLTERFGTRLGGFLSVGPRSAFPVRMITASQIVGERLAIIGNAANHLHPVAGQGLNLGVRDASALAEMVTACVRAGGDPGDPALLSAYARWRRDDQRRVGRATDALVRLFSNRFAPLVVARGLGLLAFDLLPPVKRHFARHAMGLTGRQSRLARGLTL